MKTNLKVNLFSPLLTIFLLTHPARAGNVLSGINNTAAGGNAVVSGGDGNTAGGYDSAIGGGYATSATGYYSFTGGGYGNTASETYSFAGGGFDNFATGFASFAGGGIGNIASGISSVTPGGYSNQASGIYSFAAGYYAHAVHDGSFVWADGTSNVETVTTAPNQFVLRATGGMRLGNTTSLYFGTGTRQMLNLYNTTYGIGVQASTLYQRSSGGFAWYKGGAHNGGTNNPGGGTVLATLDSSGLKVNGTFVSTSDRNAKQSFAPVDTQSVLEKVTAMPISSWSYKEDSETRHIGPMAQDFHAAFDLGQDDKHIAMVDADGIALAAIQGLQKEIKLRDARIDGLEKEMTAQRQAIEKLLQRDRLSEKP